MVLSRRTVGKRLLPRWAPVLLACIFLLGGNVSAAENLELQPLIDEALKNSPEVIASEARADAARFRIPQAKSLPDPMFMVGYQNEGFDRYSYGETLMSAWMFSASQLFPFPGKLGLREEFASKDAETFGDLHVSTRLRVSAKVKELYYDLLLAYKDLELVRAKTALFSQIEDAALARYSSGKGSQQEVLMAQAEKYMLLEKEEMFRQKIQSTEAMLNTTVGRDVNAPLGRPVEPAYRPYEESMDRLLMIAYERSPEIKAKERMVAASRVKVLLAKKEYYPDFTVSAEYDRKGGPFMDMWALRTSVNIPLYYKTKQRQGVFEAEALQVGAKNDLEATKLLIASGIRDNYSMVRTAEKLMNLYKNGLIPKTYQDFDSALSGYVTGRVDALTVISRLKALLEYETLYWGQFSEREKAIARIEAVTGGAVPGGQM
ncbi:MAG: TolC family protein [Nitrospiraceae bacterium]|nr:TolC family protein [Nitrospiraceae bacterium]